MIPQKKRKYSDETVKLLLDSSYQNPTADLGLQRKGYKKDKALSTPNHTVYLDPKDNPVIVHRGTSNWNDIQTDAALLFGLEKYTPRFREAARITKKVRKKYHKKVTAVGHSLGGSLAESSNADRVLTVNKGVGIGGLFKSIPKNQLDLRNRGDLVSVLSNFQHAKYKVNVPLPNFTDLINPSKLFQLHKYDSFFGPASFLSNAPKPVASPRDEL